MSPFLFNVYMGDIPLPPKELKLITYADDCTVMASGPTIPELEERINPYLQTLLEWFTANDLELSQGKSAATIFTTFIIIIIESSGSKPRDLLDSVSF